MFRGQGSCPMSAHQVLVHERPELFIGQLIDFRDFMRGAETVKEMQEGDTCFERGHLRDGGKVMGLLNGSRRKQRPTGLADSHHILMVTIDRKGVRRNCTG